MVAFYIEIGVKRYSRQCQQHTGVRASLLLPSMQFVNSAIENGFRRLVASVYAPNVGSARVLEKNGFVLEGRLREHRVGRDGVIMDELLFGRILRERILDDASTAERST